LKEYDGDLSHPGRCADNGPTFPPSAVEKGRPREDRGNGGMREGKDMQKRLEHFCSTEYALVMPGGDVLETDDMKEIRAGIDEWERSRQKP
jgi:hypothetical protein